MKKITYIIGVLLGLFVLAYALAAIIEANTLTLQDKIIIISIEGVISSESADFFTKGIASPRQIIRDIQEAEQDASIKGIIFDINSPGGSVVASQEIADAIKKINKTNYAVIREVGASGGYWAASASDKIYASEMSITGSVGVLSSYLEFSELFEKYGIGYERMVGGKYKDLGSPYKELSDDERNILQNKINLVHEFFIKEVARNRNLSVEEVRSIATGEFYLGNEAKELKLIDKFGNRDTAIAAMKEELQDQSLEVQEVEHKESLLNLLSLSAYYMGQGIGSVLKEDFSASLEQTAIIEVR